MRSGTEGVGAAAEAEWSAQGVLYTVARLLGTLATAREMAGTWAASTIFLSSR